MSVLAIDMVTTGLRSADGGPGRLIQLTWVQISEDDQVVKEESLLIQPEGFEIPSEAEYKHGISIERVLTEGVPLSTALTALAKVIVNGIDFVAHDAALLRAVVTAEAERISLPNPIGDHDFTCTMRLGVRVCRIPRKGGWKRPTLEELHQHLFNKGIENPQGVLTRARATARCYKRLREAGALDSAPKPVAVLTEEQGRVLSAVKSFMASDRGAFVLLGAAGTGKTTLLSHIAKEAVTRGRMVQILTPTGRAASVASQRTGLKARTIHSYIYNYGGIKVDDDDVESSVTLTFDLRPNDAPSGTIYLIDEASMVADHPTKDGQIRFGSGRLLSDLISFTQLQDRNYGHQVIFVGDPAQLPPVGSPNSPALEVGILRERFGITAEVFELTVVLRQKTGSGILKSAHRIRQQISRGDFSALGLDEEGADVEEVSHLQVVSVFLKATEAGGPDAAILIAPTNRVTAELNSAVRRSLFGAVPALVEGDRLIIVQNNLELLLFNGDFVDLMEVSERVERRTPLRGVTLTWREVTVRETRSHRRVTAFLIEDLVHSATGNLSAEQERALMVDFRTRHPHLKPHSKSFEEALRSDPYVRALRARHGYALTCHKAQGGEWPTAIIVFDGRKSGWANEDYFRWTYTAISRARQRLIVVRPPRHTAYSDLSWEDTGTANEPVTEVKGITVALKSIRIEITATQDLPFRRRFTLARDGIVGRIDLVYDGKRIVKSVQPMGMGAGRELAIEAVCALVPVVGQPLDPKDDESQVFDPPADFFEGQPHLASFFDELRSALSGTEIEIISVEHHQWMERYVLRRGNERAQLDFFYNGKGRITKARPAQPSKLAAEVQERWQTR